MTARAIAASHTEGRGQGPPASSRLALAIVVALTLSSAAVLLGACGSAATPAASQAPAFAWLRPSPAPAAWHTTQLPGGVTQFSYPPDWRAIKSDPGTVSVALRTRTGAIRGYLNATPLQGTESLSNWSDFRLSHNRDEGDTNVTLVASATNLQFRSGRGSCVVDTYASLTGRNYREIACIVAGASETTVIVGAAPPAQWSQQGTVIERAISSFLT